MNHSLFALYSYWQFSRWNRVKSRGETRLLSIKWLVNFESKCKAFQYKWKQVHYEPWAVSIVPGAEIELWHYCLHPASFSPAVRTHLSAPETHFIFFPFFSFTFMLLCMQEHLENLSAKSLSYKVAP